MGKENLYNLRIKNIMNLKKLAEYNTFVLSILLVVKVMFCFVYGGIGMLAGSPIAQYIFTLSIIYLLSFIGILKKIKWGSLLAGTTIIIDTIILFRINSVVDLILCINERDCLFILIIHIFLLFLSIIEYKLFSSTPEKK